MTNENEKHYIEGHRMAWAAMLEKCVEELGYKSPEVSAIIQLERAKTRAALVCDELGLEPPGTTVLADVIVRIGRAVLEE